MSKKVLPNAEYHTISNIFKGLPKDQYDQTIKSGINQHLPSKKFLFHQGDPASKCYLVTKGQLKLSKIKTWNFGHAIFRGITKTYLPDRLVIMIKPIMNSLMPRR